jgi:hypothetical protein
MKATGLPHPTYVIDYVDGDGKQSVASTRARTCSDIARGFASLVTVTDITVSVFDPRSDKRVTLARRRSRQAAA